MNRWLDLANTVVLHPGNRHSQLLQQLLAQSGTGGNLTSDAHLAALATEHGATLCSCDHDFARFAGLDWVNPLRSI